MEDNLKSAMDEIASINKKGDKGTANLKGKTYTNVSTRVEVFRKHFGLEYGIETAPLFPANGGIFMQAWVKDKDSKIVGTGHAFASKVSAEKGIEKLETTAIGRAMASIGLAGGEYASDVEMETWQDRYSSNPPANTTANGISPVQKTANKDLNSWWKDKLVGLKDFIDHEDSTIQKLDDGWNKLQYSDKFQLLTEEQQGVLNDQYDSTRIQIERQAT